MKNNQSCFLDQLNSYITQYLPVTVGASDNTIKSYKYTFILLFRFLESKNLSADKVNFSDLNFSLLTDFLSWLEQERKCSRSTRNQRLAALLSFSKYAQNRTFEAASIFRREILKIPMKKAPKKHRPSFSMEEVSLMFSLPDLKQHFGFRDQVLLCTLYASGARAQEICDLKVRSLVNSEIGTSLIITGKGEKTRRIRISDKCATLLKEFIKRRKIADKPDAHIFSSLIHEKMTISCVEEIVKKYVRLGKEKRPDLFLEEGYTAHSWRHTIAVHMIEAGLSIVVIKNFLGHSSIVTTQIYAELTQASVDKKIKEWNEKWFSPDVKAESNNEQKLLLDFLTP